MNQPRNLDNLNFFSAITAAAAWLAAIILAGILTRSWIIAGGIALGFALFIFGYIKEGPVSSGSAAKSFPWILMIGSLLLTASILFSQKLGWVGIGLIAMQIPRFVIDQIIIRNVRVKAQEKAPSWPSPPPHLEIKMKEPHCSVCGKLIPALSTTIGDDIRRSGGVIIGGGGLDETLYRGIICRACGRIYCDNCHNVNSQGYDCPYCKQPLSPLFADYLRG